MVYLKRIDNRNEITRKRNLENNSMNNIISRQKSSETKKRKFKEGLAKAWNKRDDLREEASEIIRLYRDELLNYEEIGRRYNCSEIVIRAILKENGVIINQSERMRLLNKAGKLKVWNKGLTKDDERIKACSEKLTGKKLSEEHKEQAIKNLRPHKTGEFNHSEISKLQMGKTRKERYKEGTIIHPMLGKKRPDLIERNWKGGITPLNRLLRNSSLYKIWRELVFLRDNFTCQNENCSYCNNKTGVYLHPHHIKSFSEYPELRFNVENGITYCKEFHINSKLLHKDILKGVNKNFTL